MGRYACGGSEPAAPRAEYHEGLGRPPPRNPDKCGPRWCANPDGYHPVRLEVKAVNGIFQGTLSPDKKTIKGTWTQGGPVLPLEFTRTADNAEAPKLPDPAAIE